MMVVFCFGMNAGTSAIRTLFLTSIFASFRLSPCSANRVSARARVSLRRSLYRLLSFLPTGTATSADGSTTPGTVSVTGGSPPPPRSTCTTSSRILSPLRCGFSFSGRPFFF
uniref:Putative secreted peptide n=1 Tax=Anopheles braziliensis TaxID=58242 RepID=A0A2M3ZQZ4_9DIPT